MSGGSMNYLYSLVEGAEFKLNTIERLAFKAHLERVAKALKAIEWVDSGDCSAGSENAAILECISSTDCLAAAISQAEKSKVELSKCIDDALALYGGDKP